MKPSLLKLQKFFKLEAERGYDNRAVMGGLSRMLEPWEAEARQDGLPEELIATVLSRLRDYNRLSPASRQEALQGLWSRIQSEVGASPIPEGDAADDHNAVEEPITAITVIPEKVEEAEGESAIPSPAEQSATEPEVQEQAKPQTAPEPETHSLPKRGKLKSNPLKH